MPVRALRPYAHDRVLGQAKINARRANDPIRKLYQTPTWRATRLVVLSRDPTCKMCGTATSTIADHIISARAYVAANAGELTYFFDEINLQGLCKSCHDAKTAKEVGWAGG